MFSKVDFSDINKFIVSLGLIFVITGLFVPKYLLSDVLSYKISQVEYDALTQSSKDIILKKERMIDVLFIATPITTLIMLGLGAFCIRYGLRRWSIKQMEITDAIDKATLLKLQSEIRPQSREEKVTNILLDDITESNQKNRSSEQLEKSDIPVITPDPIADDDEMVRETLQVEDIVLKKILARNPLEYEILTDVMVSDFPIDILMQSRIAKLKDRAFEIKYLSNATNYSSIFNTIDRLVGFEQHYRVNFGKFVVPLLILVYKDEILSEKDAVRLDSTLREYIGKNPVFLRVYSRTNLEQSNLSDIL